MGAIGRNWPPTRAYLASKENGRPENPDQVKGIRSSTDRSFGNRNPQILQVVICLLGQSPKKSASEPNNLICVVGFLHCRLHNDK